MLQQSALSLEYLLVTWSAKVNGVAVDPTSPALAVQMAFPATGSPPATWLAAGWEADGSGGWKARCLVGPAGTVTLPPGDYDVWVKVTSTPEVPIRRSTDVLRIN